MSTFDFSTFSGSTLTRQSKFTAHLPCAGAHHFPEPSDSLPYRPSDRGTLLSTLVTMSAGRPPMIPSAPGRATQQSRGSRNEGHTFKHQE